MEEIGCQDVETIQWEFLYSLCFRFYLRVPALISLYIWLQTVRWNKHFPSQDDFLYGFNRSNRNKTRIEFLKYFWKATKEICNSETQVVKNSGNARTIWHPLRKAVYMCFKWQSWSEMVTHVSWILDDPKMLFTESQTFNICLYWLSFFLWPFILRYVLLLLIEIQISYSIYIKICNLIFENSFINIHI